MLLEVEEDATAVRLARTPMMEPAIRRVQAGVCCEARIANCYAGKGATSWEDEPAWCARWTAAYRAACWARETR